VAARVRDRRRGQARRRDGRPAARGRVPRGARFLDSARGAHQRKSNSALGPVAEHLGIFLARGVPGVLVQLYQSDDERRRAEAERAIRCFLSPDPPAGKSIVKALTAPVLLEFCGSFATGARKGDPLYAALRAMVATVLSDPEWTPGLWGDVPRRRVAEQMIRLAKETAVAVIVEIAGAYRSRSQPSAATRNLAEFKTFWSALRPQVLELDADTPLRPWRKALSQTLEALLKSVEDCMTRFEMNLPPAAAAGRKHNSSSSALPKWTASLQSVWAVLAELDAWSQKDEFWFLRHALRAALAEHPAAVTALVLSAGREMRRNSSSWIARHRDILPFEARRHLAMAMLPELVAGVHAPPPYEMLIDRPRLLPDSFGYIARATPQELGAGLSVAFKHEQATGPAC